ncbi:PREDICTED: 39S ribosomal protein L32, mitochondrial [Vollenhovia emeryi]|uniref:39S ribosomal protein L32, mitochondrial n=1 Tax=Vollenhovia emeryi TaxID=411798 RepID=UPI0005F49A1E|nr:PREDICTED: 39S ribosomal protein L32, mitochondrial [Vollenhovia emeryi]XP_011875995.1 PREDICTED: 39S ribosomal protein L32, mitochondrial [Vollenhovia emeryi]
MNRLSLVFQKFEQAIQTIFGRGFPPGPLCAVTDCHGFPSELKSTNLGRQSLKDIIGNGIVWAVPKRRRSLERRLMRKFGVMKYNWKPSIAKTNILMCVNCGYHHEAGRLCGHCYEKVKLETQEMQDAIQEGLGLNPVEKDVIVLYEGERNSETEKFWKNQRIVELPKKRPSWFHQNLLEPTTQEPSDKKDVKPTHLA